LAAAEPVEPRGGAKENAEPQSTVRTQSREAVLQAQVRIQEAVIRNRQSKLTALLHHINVDVLRASFSDLKKTAAPGVDEMTWTEYAKHLEANLLDLHARVHTGAYRALQSRRKYIPKADGTSLFDDRDSASLPQGQDIDCQSVRRDIGVWREPALRRTSPSPKPKH
jgi:RNA-directed DNA polymerase